MGIYQLRKQRLNQRPTYEEIIGTAYLYYNAGVGYMISNIYKSPTGYMYNIEQTMECPYRLETWKYYDGQNVWKDDNTLVVRCIPNQMRYGG